MANGILMRLFEHNRWANEEMVGACARLSEEQLSVAVPGTYGRLDQTLIHLARAQGGYLRRLTDWQPGDEHRLEYDEPFPGVPRVLDHLTFTGERLIDVAAGLDEERTVDVPGAGNGEVVRLPAWVVLLQAAYHATEHRQQVATSLTHLGVEPPEPDFWAYAETIDR